MKTLKLAALMACLPVCAQQQQPEPMVSLRETYVIHKTAHAVIGMAVTYTFAELGYPKTSAFMALLLGVAKELYDQRHGGSFRTEDVAWTFGPALVVSYSYKW